MHSSKPHSENYARGWWQLIYMTCQESKNLDLPAFFHKYCSHASVHLSIVKSKMLWEKDSPVPPRMTGLATKPRQYCIVWVAVTCWNSQWTASARSYWLPMQEMYWESSDLKVFQTGIFIQVRTEGRGSGGNWEAVEQAVEQAESQLQHRVLVRPAATKWAGLNTAPPTCHDTS